MADTLISVTPRTERDTGKVGGAGRSRPHRPRLAGAGLLPFFGYVLVFFLVPIGFILYNAFRRTITATSTHRDPVTQQFIHTSRSSYTGQNVSASLDGIYRTSLVNSVELSAVVAVVGAVIGLLLAYAVVSSSSGLLQQVVSAAAAVTANFGGIPLAFLFIATIGVKAGLITQFLQDHLHVSLADDLHFQLTSVTGVGLVYMYFLVPLMVLVMTPAGGADAGQPVAFVQFAIVDGGAYIEEIDVLPAHAGHRLAARLIDAVDVWARSQGLPILTLSTFSTIPWNAPYYRRLGFRDMGHLGPGLAAIRERHRALGLKDEQRAFLWRPVAR